MSHTLIEAPDVELLMRKGFTAFWSEGRGEPVSIYHGRNLDEEMRWCDPAVMQAAAAASDIPEYVRHIGDQRVHVWTRKKNPANVSN